jgi:hypothetical protein
MRTSRGINPNFVVDAEQSSPLFHVPEVAQVPSKLWPEVQRHVPTLSWVRGVSCFRTNVAEVIAQEVVETIQEELALSNT